MKIYANRYGMIESTELAFALQSEKRRRDAAAAVRSRRGLRRAARRERWRERRQQAGRMLSAIAAELRAVMVRATA